MEALWERACARIFQTPAAEGKGSTWIILHLFVIPWCKMQRFAFTGKFQVETNQQAKLIEDLTGRSEALRGYL